MSDTNGTPVQHRYDFVYLFDVTDGNPNGDPDAGNLPRLDPETGQGLVTDVCLKRKIRNFVAIVHPDDQTKRIFVRERSVLNASIQEAYSQSEELKASVRMWDAWKANKKKNPKPDIAYEDVARRWMCENFYDIRAFGAVMSTGDEQEVDGLQSKLKMTAGQVRGPVQLGIARSIDPIVSSEHAITRCAVTNERDLEKERTMGRKFTVPYGLYRVHGYINATLADPARNGTGFSESDLELLKQALDRMFETDRSAARGNMAPRGCIAFRHDSALGNARADQLFRRVSISLKSEAREAGKPARSFDDYEVTVDEKKLPAGVTVEHWVQP
jgi:CRISPR-associated protein Csd2